MPSCGAWASCRSRLQDRVDAFCHSSCVHAASQALRSHSVPQRGELSPAWAAPPGGAGGGGGSNGDQRLSSNDVSPMRPQRPQDPAPAAPRVVTLPQLSTAAERAAYERIWEYARSMGSGGSAVTALSADCDSTGGSGFWGCHFPSLSKCDCQSHSKHWVCLRTGSQCWSQTFQPVWSTHRYPSSGCR